MSIEFIYQLMFARIRILPQHLIAILILIQLFFYAHQFNELDYSSTHYIQKVHIILLGFLKK